MFYYEAARYGSNDEFTFSEFEDFNFPLHLHRCFELIYIKEGYLTVNVDNETQAVSKNKLVLIFPNQVHSYKTLEHSKGFVCIFSPEYVSMFYQHCKNKRQTNMISQLKTETSEFVLKTYRIAKTICF